MIQIINDKEITLLDEGKSATLHKGAFKETLNAIQDFCKESIKIYKSLQGKRKKDPSKQYIHNVLCSAPGHGKTTALEYHIKLEIYQTQTKKNPYLLVFNNNDTMNNFFEYVNEFATLHKKKNAIIAINEQNFEQFKEVLDHYQVVCIMHQRFKDLALGFGDLGTFLKYQQEQVYWGKKPPDAKKTLVHRTIIIDEMPMFFNSTVFDIGKEHNVLDWYDAFTKNTTEDVLSAEKKNNGRRYINGLISNELNNIGNTSKRLLRSIEGSLQEQELLQILDSLNKNESDNESVLRYRWFMKLLTEDDVGAINRTAKKTNILCSEFIDYKHLGNILVLDGTSNLTKTIYNYAGFQIKLINNYHRYIERLFFEWDKINTSSSKRADSKSEIRDQIAEHLIELRSKGIDIFPIPSKGDTSFYIKKGAITSEQHEQFFRGRQFDNGSLSINLHNVTGKNDLSQYNHIALLNLPIMQPDEYRLQAIAMYGTDTDLRLVKDLDDIEEQKLHKGQWFVEPLLQNLFEEQQKAELSQIIHRSSIRNIHSDEKVTIHLYHNKERVNDLLKEIFRVPDSNFTTINIQLNNNFKVKCRQWAEKIIAALKSNPNEEYTAFKVGGNKFKKWLNNHWNEHEEVIRDIFSKHEITILIKGKGNYKYFTYIDDEFYRYFVEEPDDLFA
ncbi:hypothetical protein [Bacillus litorisediminis]|uniref:hypothetical protein n=1 Tax=Bacillus litorisediminis TaxID=2922713 RepID=UPI001FAF9162|nr:hypothetical protein [Bacillus litorisediminis]